VADLRGVRFLLFFVVTAAGHAQELRPGLWAGRDLSRLPLPVSEYEVYMVGEMHGVKETEGVLLEYLAMLYAGAGLRDVAIEEKAVYQRDAQDYVEGKSDAVPESLCLRAGLLGALRRFNEGRKENELVHVHLVDIDSPATAIRQHLLTVKERIPGTARLRVPEVADIKAHGLDTVAALQKMTADPETLGELRTAGHSIRAYQQGLEFGTGQAMGSPCLDDREEAISSNIIDLLRNQHRRAVLALYGSDHVSRARRKDGGEQRDREFSPVALRLEEVDAFLLFAHATPMENRCAVR
jgi:hypothetical protein